MDRTPLRKGGLMQMWIPNLGGETTYEADLPACCRRSARGSRDSFECSSCGAAWQAPQPTEPEHDAFTAQQEHKGAA